MFVASQVYSQNMAFVFDGETSYLSGEVSNGSKIYPDGTDKISIEAWVYLIGDNGGDKIPVVTRSNGNSDLFSLSVQNGEVSFAVSGDQISSIGANIQAFKWVHVAGTFDGTNKKLYVNGKEVGAENYSIYSIK